MDSIANHSPEKVIARTSECMRRLLEAGLTFEALQMPIDDPVMRQRLVRYWLAGSFEHCTSVKRAEEIMGQNFFGIEDAQRWFGVIPAKRAIAHLQEVPWTEEVLQSVKDSHILIAAFPLSILDMRERLGEFVFSHSPPGSWCWYKTESFAKLTPRVDWVLMRKTLVPEADTLPSETPTAAFLIYATLGYAFATGDHLFRDHYLRCSDSSSDRSKVHVGFWDKAWVNITDIHGFRSDKFSSIGVAAIKNCQR